MALRIREGGAEDADVLVALFDEAVEWLTARGSSGQWGTELWSSLPDRVETERRRAAGGGLWIAEDADGTPVGALVAKEKAPGYVPAASEPELYVTLLLTSRRRKGTGVGAALLEHARALAGGLGVGLMRLDCWAGGDGKLGAYYESQGFTPTEPFMVKEWKGQVLEMRLPQPPPA